jgi:hypothetical protein
MAYAILLRWDYGRRCARSLGGLLVALAPFELVLGSLRANDSYLELAGAAGLTSLVLLERRPVLQGIAIAVLLLVRLLREDVRRLSRCRRSGSTTLLGRRWRAMWSFTVASAVLHGATCLFWNAKIGTFFPFFSAYAANYPVPAADLPDLFLKYPRLMFVGSYEFPTTLWGWLPHLLVALLAREARRLDRRVVPRAAPLRSRRPHAAHALGNVLPADEFLPQRFKLDAYYSVPRIFRYLAPLVLPDRPPRGEMRARRDAAADRRRAVARAGRRRRRADPRCSTSPRQCRRTARARSTTRRCTPCSTT